MALFREGLSTALRPVRLHPATPRNRGRLRGCRGLLAIADGDVKRVTVARALRPSFSEVCDHVDEMHCAPRRSFRASGRLLARAHRGAWPEQPRRGNWDGRSLGACADAILRRELQRLVPISLRRSVRRTQRQGLVSTRPPLQGHALSRRIGGCVPVRRAGLFRQLPDRGLHLALMTRGSQRRQSLKGRCGRLSARRVAAPKSCAIVTARVTSCDAEVLTGVAPDGRYFQ